MRATLRYGLSVLTLALFTACTGTANPDAGDSTASDAALDTTTDTSFDVRVDTVLEADARVVDDMVDVVVDVVRDIAPDAAPDAEPDSGCDPTSMCDGACVDLQTNSHHCGACGRDCAALPGVDAARASCVAGVCDLTTSCTAGRAHCSSDPMDGCEADVTTASACGACGTVCAAPTPTCAMQTGGTYACSNGCSAGTPTLCGTTCVDTTSDFRNCGGCGTVCPSYPNAMATCTAGVCGRVCLTSAHECGGNCTSDYDTASCGPSSCTPCPSVANASTTCDGTTCGFRCNAGFRSCGGACVTDSPAACGASCAVCTAPANATPLCASGTCDFACNRGYTRTGSTCIPVPRQIAPASTSYVTSRRPTLRWELASGTDGVRVDLCGDRACSMVITTFDSTATTAVPAMDLPIGAVYWRLTAMNGGAVTTQRSATWPFTVGARSAAIDTSWGSVLDLEGDGYADVVVSATRAEHVYVYRGGAAGPATTATTTLSPPPSAGGDFGTSVASAGDVNGDGYADLVVGAQTAPSFFGTNGPGMVFVYFGSATGIATTPSVSILGPDGGRGAFGASVAAAGDVDRDGYGDIVVGAPAAPSSTMTGAGPGRAYIFLGGPGGTSTTASTTLSGPSAMSNFGLRVASAGDVNGDGYSDVLFGAANAASTAGQFELHLGGASGLATTAIATRTGPATNQYFGGTVACAGDVNGDGYTDVLVGATGGTFGSGNAYLYVGSATGITLMPTRTIPAPDGGGFSASLSSAGDVNGDGFSDVVIGAPTAGPGSITMPSPGKAYVFVGGAAGLATTPTALTGPDVGGSFGIASARAGDIDHDGFEDIVIGAYQAGPSLVGRAYVYRGSASGIVATPAPTLTGTDGSLSRFGLAVE